jgi:hypothetical protein
MASTRAMIERRRASRVSISIPVKLSGDQTQGEQHNTHAEAIAVSRCGALIRAPFSPALGSRIEVLNGLSQETREFRVVRVTDAKERGFFHLGLEILYPARNFWGVLFPDEQRPY